MVFIIALGGCIGSFLNVVIYRLPRDISLVHPPSACPECNTQIKFYHNIPIVSWLALRGKCKYCQAKISPRYFVIELLTALVFASLFAVYFIFGMRSFGIDGEFGVHIFVEGAWIVYLVHILMLSGLIAASAIDLQLWLIPLSVCWFITASGVTLSTVAGYVIDPSVIRTWHLFPRFSASIYAMAVGALAGLIISLIGLATGIIKRSYESDEDEEESEDGVLKSGEPVDDGKFDHRREILKEMVFLLPIIIGTIVAFQIFENNHAAKSWWVGFTQVRVVEGLLGALWGYFVGCAVVWGTRILGTLGFGKEAMGLGDMHLMGAAGAIIGPVFVVLAFFAAPFFGLSWAGYQAFFKKTRQIPYGPFLSMGILTVIIFHDRIISYMHEMDLYFLY